MKLIPAALSLLLLVSTAAPAQRSWRGRHRMEQSSPAALPVPMAAADSDMVSASGFEKTLRSSIESLFVTNHTPDSICRIRLHIEYTDAADRQLHSRDESINLLLPPGSTRRVELRSFDRQGTFYYHRSAPPRTRGNATPFKVRLRIDSVGYTARHNSN